MMFRQLRVVCCRGGLCAAMLLVASGLLAGCTSAADTNSADQDLRNATAPLSASDFKNALDKSFIRDTNGNLSDNTFAAKWTASHDSAVMFMRAYPGAFHQDLAQVATRRIPGKEATCFGDAHPDNFGFLRVNATTMFSYNDLDDSGLCLAALDAARYFAILRLYFDDKTLSADVLEQYVDTLKDTARAAQIDLELAPSWKTERARKVDSLTTGDSIKLTGGVVKTPSVERAAISDLVAKDTRLVGTTLVDVATMESADGGSGGLRRYWLLVDSEAGRTVLELKEAATPGTELGRHSQPLPPATRLAVLTTAFWGQTPKADYRYVIVQGTRFLMRDRLAKASVNLDNLSSRARLSVLRVQASRMALLHAAALADVKKDDLRAWLSGSAQTLADRWSAAFKR